MSQPDLSSQQGVVVQKPKSDVYTMMLVISLIAMAVAIIFLLIEASKYDWDFKAQDVKSAVQGASATALDLRPSARLLV
ncbi:MAG: hypothetical protein HYS13_25180 [Planctomycetia bacterium]|nr:hypothetical protein [Planctomycetia bacterium]